MNGKIRSILLAGLLVLAGAAILLLRHTGYLLPGWISWEQRTISGTAHSEAPQTITLQHRAVTVTDAGRTVWRSDRGVRVQDVLWGDIDHDEQNELMLLCWKRGRYGSSRPFWVTEDDQTWSQHIYLYDWEAGTMQPIWMASDLGREVERWSFSQSSRLVLTERDGSQSAWDWVTWGLSHVEPARLTFAAVGDNLVHRQIRSYALRHFDGQFDDLFAGVQAELDQYDVTSINQETILVDDPGQYSDYPRFGTPLAVGEAIIRAGFDIVTCATNHALDKGTDAIDLTAALFREAGVLCAGIQPSEDPAYRPYEILEQNGIRCAVFSYTESTNGLSVPADMPHVLHTLEDEAQIRQDLADGSQNADFCIVYVHWGEEYSPEPTPAQRHWAQVFADSGAHVVIGTHPHVMQPMERITSPDGRETLIYYSLGNFISAQTEQACTVGGLAYFTLVKENGTCRIEDSGLKTLLTQNENGHYTTVMAEP